MTKAIIKYVPQYFEKSPIEQVIEVIARVNTIKRYFHPSHTHYPRKKNSPQMSTTKSKQLP